MSLDVALYGERLEGPAPWPETAKLRERRTRRTRVRWYVEGIVVGKRVAWSERILRSPNAPAAGGQS